MPGIGIIIPRPGTGTGPVVPDPLYDLGVSGFQHRWAGERLGEVGALSAWEDTTGDSPLLPHPDGVAGSIAVADEDGEKFVRLDNATTGSTTILAEDVMPTPSTLVTVARKAATAGTDIVAFGGGVRLSRPSNGALRAEAYGTGSSSSQLERSGFSLNTWHIIIAVMDGTSPALRLNASETTSPSASPFTPGDYEGLAFYAAGNASDIKLDIRTVNVINRVLDAGERAQVVAALQARYTDL